MISQNKKISAEIQLLMGRDNELRNILNRDGHLQDVRYENHQIINDSLEKVKMYINSDINNNNIPPSNPQMSQISQSRVQRSTTYGMDSNRNLNRSQNGEQPGIISNMNNNYNNISNSNINMSGTGRRINPGLSSNMNNNEEHEQEQGQGDEEEMINMGENEPQIEQENQNEEEYEHEEQNNNLN